MTHSLLYFLIIFGPRNPWESRAILNQGQILETREFLIFIITPNEHGMMALSSPDSYESNGTTYMRIHALYEEIRKLPGFCLHVWEETWPSGYTSCYTSLESYWRDESSAVDIVRNGWVVVEKRANYVGNVQCSGGRGLCTWDMASGLPGTMSSGLRRRRKSG